MKNTNTQIIAFSSPSGGGKTTIIKILLEKYNNFKVSISATTRKPRDKETNGIDYYFISHQIFKEKIANNEFLEYEEVHGNMYGTLKSEVTNAQKNNQVLLFDIDVKGALSIKKIFPQTKLIFIKPPTLEELENRLKLRETENADSIKKRLSRIKLEFAAGNKFDFIVINNNLQEAVKEVENIIFNN